MSYEYFAFGRQGYISDILQSDLLDSQTPISCTFWICWWASFPEKFRPLRVELRLQRYKPTSIFSIYFIENVFIVKIWVSKLLQVLSQTYGLCIKHCQIGIKISASQKGHTCMTASEYFLKKVPLWYEINIKTVLKIWGRSASRLQKYCLPLITDASLW